MRISVESRIHRTLRGLKAFNKCARWEDLSYSQEERPPFAEGEQLLGVYENEPGSSRNAVVFTSLGVHIRKPLTWHSAKYVEMNAPLWPEEDKREVRTLTIPLKNGSCEVIPLYRGFVFDVMRFFDRVLSDLREQDE